VVAVVDTDDVAVVTWRWCVVGAVVVVAGPGFIVSIIIAVAPFVVAVVRVVTVDARRRRCHTSFVMQP